MTLPTKLYVVFSVQPHAFPALRCSWLGVKIMQLLQSVLLVCQA